MKLHVHITNKGGMEQLGSMFSKRKKFATKQTKGEWKYNDKRLGKHPKGLHPDYTKKKKHIKSY